MLFLLLRLYALININFPFIFHQILKLLNSTVLLNSLRHFDNRFALFPSLQFRWFLGLQLEFLNLRSLRESLHTKILLERNIIAFSLNSLIRVNKFDRFLFWWFLLLKCLILSSSLINIINLISDRVSDFEPVLILPKRLHHLLITALKLWFDQSLLKYLGIIKED